MRAGSTLLEVRGNGVRLGASKSLCDDPKRANSLLCRHHKKTASPAPAPSPTTTGPTKTFFGPGSIFNHPGATTTPATPPPPTTPAPAPAPAPAPTPTPQCTTDWTAAAAEVRRIAQAVRSCETPNASLPAQLAPCPTGSGGGTGSYDDYLRAREEFKSAQDDAVLCSTGQSSGDAVSPAGSGSTVIPAPGYSSSYGVSYGTEDDEVPLVEPDTTPIFSKGAKVGAGIGGLLLILAVSAVMMRKSRRSRRRA